MVQKQDFSLITVNTDEDDDVVIQAGVVEDSSDAFDSQPEAAQAQPEAAQAHPDATEGQDGASVPHAQDSAVSVMAHGSEEVAPANAVDEAASVQASDDSSEAADEASFGNALDQAASEEDRKEYLRHMRAVEARRAGEMITTEEDLHVKMPFVGMQRAIVAIGILLIVAALAYWVFLRQ